MLLLTLNFDFGFYFGFDFDTDLDFIILDDFLVSLDRRPVLVVFDLRRGICNSWYV